MKSLRAQSGFSLVELSIVLVILGLLVGGVLSGQSLIRAAELRKVSSDVSRYSAALMTFRDKYFAIPGDMNNASAFWGAADGSTGLTASCATATSAGTCNGNGDGQVTLGPESYRLWQQLNLAGLLEGNFTGTPGPAPTAGNADDVIGINIPRFPMNNGGYNISYAWSSPSVSSFSSRQNVLVAAPCCHPTFKNIEGRILRPEELWNIDRKMDDGRPLTGLVQIYAPYGCATSGEYSLNQNWVNCMPLFGMGL